MALIIITIMELTWGVFTFVPLHLHSQESDSPPFHPLRHWWLYSKHSAWVGRNSRKELKIFWRISTLRFLHSLTVFLTHSAERGLQVELSIRQAGRGPLCPQREGRFRAARGPGQGPRGTGVSVTPCQACVVPQSSYIPVLAWPLINPLTFSELVNFSVPQFPWL